MQDEHNDSPSPQSRRPIAQQEQSERDYTRQNVPQLPQQQLSSQIWTPSQSFSSQSSQEHDPRFQVSLQDPRLPSLQASLQYERPPPPPLQQSTRYPPVSTSGYFQYSSENAGIMQQTGYSERTDTQYSQPYLQHSLPQGAESQGPPLPYPYPGPSGYQELTPPPPPSQREQHSYIELPGRGGSRSPHASRHSRQRRTPPSDPPYPTRRPSQEFRPPPQSFETSLSQPFQTSSRPTSRPPSRGPSRPTQLYRSPSSVQSGPAPYRSQAGTPMHSYIPERGHTLRTSQPVMAPQSQSFAHPLLHSTTQSPFSQSQAMSMPLQQQSGRESPFSQAQAPTYHRQTGGGPRPLPNVGELTSTGGYSLAPPPPPGPLPTPRRTHRAHPYEPPPTSPVHHTRTARRRSQQDTPTTPPKRRRPPEPYSSYANMLADIISHHPRRKLTLQELYILLKSRYGEHFPDDGVDDSKPGPNGGGWRNTVRHALSVNKWFRKQYRTNADARLDEEDPDRYEPPPIDEDSDGEGKAVTVAPPTRRNQEGEITGGTRPLKGGYWFIREKFRNEVAEAVARDKEKTEQIQIEREDDERVRQVSRMHSRHVSPAIPQIPSSHRGQRVGPLPQEYMYTMDRPRESGPYGRNTGAHHHMGYPPPR